METTNKEKYFEPVTATLVANKIYDLLGDNNSSVEEFRGKFIPLISSIIEPYIQPKESVSKACEEAYIEAIELLVKYSAGIWLDTNNANFQKKVVSFLNKRNPFLDANIVEDDKPEYEPFTLEGYNAGRKVKTIDGMDVRIISTNGIKDFPIVGYVNEDILLQWSIDGQALAINNNSDLMLEKEQKEIDIFIYKQHENGGAFFAYTDVQRKNIGMGLSELIKTIKVKI